MVNVNPPDMLWLTDTTYRPLFDNCHVSPIGLGTVKMGRNRGVKYPRSFNIPNDRDVANLLALAHDLGINLIDTAPAYGNCESRLGAILSNRHQWVICTKAGEYFDGQKSSFDFSPEGLTNSVEHSLRRLATDYLDVVLLHLPDDDLSTLSSEALTALSKLKERGLIRAIGASTKSTPAGLLAVEDCDVVMIAYHQQDTTQQAVLDAALASSRGVMIKKGLESGHSGSPDENLRFLMATSMSSVIVGTINPSHLAANVATIAQVVTANGSSLR